MPDHSLLTMFGGIISVFFVLLCAILGWIGARLHKKIDDVVTAIIGIREDFHINREEFNDKLGVVDRRLSVVETRCQINHSDTHPGFKAVGY